MGDMVSVEDLVRAEGSALLDLVMRRRVEDLIKEYGIKVVVETGTRFGVTTTILSGLVPTVFGVDIDPNTLRVAEEVLRHNGRTNVVLCLGNSSDVLRSLAPLLPDETLYLLDAHAHQVGGHHPTFPVREEIDAVRRGSGVLIIHDMVVPGRPELGWETASNGTVLDHACLKEALDRWSPWHRVEYNERAESPTGPRGVGYVFPG